MLGKNIMSKQSIGGKNRANSLTDSERKKIASDAAKIRWEKEVKLPKATHRGDLTIGNLIIPCAVLENGSRIITEACFVNILGSTGGKQRKARAEMSTNEEAPIPLFLAQKSLKPFVDSAFDGGYPELIKYKDGRKIATGYQANILPQVCEIWLKARDSGSLQSQQLPKALKAEVLMRGLAQIGIVALVDEATGYQEEIDRDSLHRLLEVYLVEKKLKWA